MVQYMNLLINLIKFNVENIYAVVFCLNLFSDLKKKPQDLSMILQDLCQDY